MATRQWWAYAVVFIASGCTLILEIVAGRIIAPVVGVSLYTWTSVIGVVLAGISLGNYTGGVVADRWPARRTLGAILALGGISSLAILPLIKFMTDFHYPSGTSLVAKIVVMTAVIFFPPAFIISMTTPVVIKLSLNDLSQTGGVVGRLYAISTCGSILSTFLTGFVLIANFGTRTIVLWVAVVLLLLAIFFGGFLHGKASTSVISTGATLVAFVALLGWTARVDALQSPCAQETNYYCIRVVPTQEGSRNIEQLILDHLIHSFSDPADPTYIHYGYEKVYAEVLTYLSQQQPNLRVLELGGGGYTIPRYVEATYPTAEDTVIEIDPGVTKAAYQYMGLAANTRVVSVNEDARLGLMGMDANRKFDLILGDAFNDLSVPYHLTTQEFDRYLAQHLAPNGFFLANIIDKMVDGKFIPAIVRTLKTVFPNVYVMSEVNSFNSRDQNTYVVAASQTPLDRDRLRALKGYGQGGTVLTQVMSDEAMATWLAASGAPLLTDDYVPADNLLAPLFLERD